MYIFTHLPDYPAWIQWLIVGLQVVGFAFLAALLPMLIEAGRAALPAIAATAGSNLMGKLMGAGGAAQPPQATYATSQPPTVTATQPMDLEALIAHALGGSQSQGNAGGPMTLLPAPMNFGQNPAQGFGQ